MPVQGGGLFLYCVSFFDYFTASTSDRAGASQGRVRPAVAEANMGVGACHDNNDDGPAAVLTRARSRHTQPGQGQGCQKGLSTQDLRREREQQQQHSHKDAAVVAALAPAAAVGKPARPQVALGDAPPPQLLGEERGARNEELEGGGRAREELGGVKRKRDRVVALEDDLPLFWQVGNLLEDYNQWVHVPEFKREPARFFYSDIVEFLSRTEWYVVPLLWLPLAFLLIAGASVLASSLLHVVGAMAAGIMVWTLVEYGIHRFVFHLPTSSYWGNSLHFIVHGCHHKHPLDRLRLVFPPAAICNIVITIFAVNLVAFRTTYALAMGGGTMVGYAVYDCIHYYLHHGKPKSGYLKKVKVCAPTCRYGSPPGVCVLHMASAVPGRVARRCQGALINWSVLSPINK
eukprot:jgi/Mesvir1/1350/Mv19483-RA.3